jgi:hypothetical protein
MVLAAIEPEIEYFPSGFTSMSCTAIHRDAVYIGDRPGVNHRI